MYRSVDMILPDSASTIINRITQNLYRAGEAVGVLMTGSLFVFFNVQSHKLADAGQRRRG